MAQAPAAAEPGTVVQLWEGQSFCPFAVSVNPVDGSCWVIDGSTFQEVVHVSEDGQELCRSTGFFGLKAVQVNPADSSCWVVDRVAGTNYVVLVHLAEDGSEIWRGANTPVPWGSVSLALDQADGSCWVTGCCSNALVHVAQDGTVLLNDTGYASEVAVDPVDGSCWALVWNSNKLMHLSEEGTELWEGGGFGPGDGLAVNPVDRSCWIGDCSSTGSVVHLAEDGTQLSQTGGFVTPLSPSVNLTDGSCWVADIGNGTGAGQVTRLAADGSELWSGSFIEPYSVSVNLTDGSCWVADIGSYDSTTSTYSGGKLVHLGVQVLAITASALPTTVASGGTCDLTATAADNLGDTVASWSWSDGGAGGSFSDPTAQTPTYTAPVNASGQNLTITLTVTVTVTGTYPLTKKGTASLTVEALAPVAGFSGTPTSGQAPLAVNFTDACTNNPTSWSWTFGDGGTDTAQNPSHSYTKGGNFTVALTATDAGGSDTCTKSDYVQVATFSDVPTSDWAWAQSRPASAPGWCKAIATAPMRQRWW